jgi:outer membrane protein assembly factor BamB
VYSAEDILAANITRSLFTAHIKSPYMAGSTRRHVLAQAVILALAGCTSTGDTSSVGRTPDPEDALGPANGPTLYIANDSVATYEYTTQLYAIDARTGEHYWIYSDDDSTDPSAPTVVNGTVYLANKGGLHAIDAVSGEQVWEVDPDEWVWSDPTVVDNTVYFGTRASNIYAVDAATGEQQWKYEESEGPNNSAVHRVNDTIFFASHDSNVYALDAQTGQEKWRFTTSEDELYNSPTVWNDILYVGEEMLYAVDAKSGEEIWRFDIGVGFYSSPVVADGTVFVCSSEALHALNAKNGEEKWKYETGAGRNISPTLSNRRLFYRRSKEGSMGETELLVAVDRETGQQEWAFKGINESITTTPTVWNQTVFAGSRDGKLYAIDTDNRELEWVFNSGLGRFDSSSTVVTDPKNGDSIDTRVNLGTLGHHHTWANQ